jgi:hypothetical protein
MFAPAFEYIFGKEKKRTLMLGLDNAGLLCVLSNYTHLNIFFEGKTTILENFKLSKVDRSVFNTDKSAINVETMKSKTITIISWDLNEQSDELCRNYYPNTGSNVLKYIFIVYSIMNYSRSDFRC